VCSEVEQRIHQLIHTYAPEVLDRLLHRAVVDILNAPNLPFFIPPVEDEVELRAAEEKQQVTPKLVPSKTKTERKKKLLSAPNGTVALASIPKATNGHLGKLHSICPVCKQKKILII
jgi:hypothetical protein